MADFLRCKDCKHDKGKCVGVSRRASHKNCFEPKVKTKADRIRAMSDEELAETLYCFTELDCKIHFCKNLAECEKILDTEDGIPDEKCKRCLMEWLKQPAKG